MLPDHGVILVSGEAKPGIQCIPLRLLRVAPDIPPGISQHVPLAVSRDQRAPHDIRLEVSLAGRSRTGVRALRSGGRVRGRVAAEPVVALPVYVAHLSKPFGISHQLIVGSA